MGSVGAFYAGTEQIRAVKESLLLILQQRLQSIKTDSKNTQLLQKKKASCIAQVTSEVLPREQMPTGNGVRRRIKNSGN